MPSENANPRYIALIALVAVLVLWVGTWLKPKENQQAQGPTISRAEVQRLQRFAQRRTLEGVAGYLADTALGVASQLVRVPALESSGLVWNTRGLLITAHPGVQAPDRMVVVAAGGTPWEAQTTIASPDLPVMALQAPTGSDRRPVAVRSSAELKPGEWVIAVSRQGDGSQALASGWFSGIVSATCEEMNYRRMLSSVPLTAEMRGGGLFDLDGKLVAVIIRCGDAYTAMVTEDVNPILLRGASLNSHLLERFGLRVELLNAAAQAYFQTPQGVLITEVWKHYPAETIGLNPGDVIVALNGQPVQSLADLEVLVGPGTEEAFEFSLRRSRRTVRVTLSAKTPEGSATLSSSSPEGISLGTEMVGFRIESVHPNSRAAQAGLQAGDRLLRVGISQTINLAAARRALTTAAQGPTFIVFERGDRIRGVFLR